MEHARRFAGEKDEKWVADTHKVVKVLHDMLYQLQLHTGGDSQTNLKQLQVVGMVAAGKRYERSRSPGDVPLWRFLTDCRVGWSCQLLRMVYAKGYMCLLCGDDVRKIPNSTDKISDLLELLGVLWRFRVSLSYFHPAQISTYNYS